MEIRLNFTDVTEKISRSLSIMGKRAFSEKGDSLYDAITLSSNEQPLINDFIRAGVLRIVTAIRSFMRSKTDDGFNIVITYDMPSGKFFASTNEESLQQVAEDYVVSYSLARWFSLVLPSQQEFYAGDAGSNLAMIVSMLYETEALHADVSLNRVSNP